MGGTGGVGGTAKSDGGSAVDNPASTGGTVSKTGTSKPDASTDAQPPTDTGSSCYQEGLAAITQELLAADIAMLASPELEGRKTGTAGERKAIDYIVGQFKAAGLDGVAGNYEQPFTAQRMTSANTIAVVEGSDPTLKGEVIVLGGHHDHLGKTTRGYYPGADDNASGSAAVMALGRAFAKCKGQLKRTLLFMTFGGEEEGLLGSLYYAKNPLFPIAKTMYMVNFDMIGYVAKNKLEISWGSTLVKEMLTSACRTLSFCKLIQSDMVNELGTDSDAFAAARVPYTDLFSGFHDCYHKTCDTADKLDMKGVTDTTKLSFDLVHLLATTDQSLAKPATRTTGTTIDRSKRPFLDHGVAPIGEWQ
jgi:aminopeptidase YwaD